LINFVGGTGRAAIAAVAAAVGGGGLQTGLMVLLAVESRPKPKLHLHLVGSIPI